MRTQTPPDPKAFEADLMTLHLSMRNLQAASTSLRNEVERFQQAIRYCRYALTFCSAVLIALGLLAFFR